MAATALLLLALPCCHHAFTAPRPSRWAAPAPRRRLSSEAPRRAAAAAAAAAAPPYLLILAATTAGNDDDANAKAADDGAPTPPPPANLPFFASLTEPAFPSGTKTDSVGTGTATVTTRIPLGTLFDSRDYILTAATNVRGYEWTTKETDELYDDLSDVALASSNESPNRHGLDYELSQIVLVPMEWDRDMFGLGGRYDVHDGQQRLVTLCMLFAALRESFRAPSSAKGGGHGGSNHDEIVEELTSMLNPPKVRKAPLLRIELRERDNEMLRRILTPDIVVDVDENDREIEGTVRIDLPSTSSDATGQEDETEKLSATNCRVLTNYHRLSERVSELNVDERLELLDYLVEHVYMLVCVPETASIARNIVMGQGKGMNTEPIDDFKGLVCFRYTLKENDMYQTFDKWDNLAAMPDDSSSEEENNESVVSVGRDIVASACLLRATAALRAKIRKNDEVHSLESWLRRDLITNECEGKDFYERNVEPPSLALRKFRDGTFDSFGFMAVGGGGVGSGGEDDELRTSIETRLRYLRGMTLSVASTKEVEIVVLELLLRAEGAIEGFEPLTLQDLDGYLHGVELAAVWMAVARPSPLQRHQRCFDMLNAIDSANLDGMLDAVFATREERSKLRDDLASFDFGSTPLGKKIAVSLLERLNSHLLSLTQDGGEAELPRGDATQYQVEHILPTNPYRKYWKDEWPDEDDRNDWTHRLGNLALVSRKVTAKEGNSAFDDKKERYQKEVWPLTRQLSELGDWSKEALIEHHEKSMDLIGKIWGL